MAKRGIKNGFKPTDLQRRTVKSLVNSSMTNTDICQCIYHQVTGKPITERMMKTHFKEEIGVRHEGAPKFVPTEDQRKIVRTAAGCGMIQESIVKLITNPGTGSSIGRKTLRDNFRKELDCGMAIAEYQVTGRLFQTAVSKDHPGATTAAIFICKTKYGYSEKQIIEHQAGVGVLIAPASVTPTRWIEEANARNGKKKSPVDDGRRN